MCEGFHEDCAIVMGWWNRWVFLVRKVFPNILKRTGYHIVLFILARISRI